MVHNTCCIMYLMPVVISVCCNPKQPSIHAARVVATVPKAQCDSLMGGPDHFFNYLLAALRERYPARRFTSLSFLTNSRYAR